MSEIPNFDISVDVGRDVLRRFQDSAPKPLEKYALPVFLRMRRDHRALYDLMGDPLKFKTDLTEPVRIGRMFGTALSYDAITSQITLLGESIDIDATDIAQFALDKITRGRNVPILSQSILEANRTANWIRQQLRTGQATGDVDWFTDIIRERTPNYDAFMRAILTGKNAELSKATMEGMLPPTMIFFRRVGVYGRES